MVFPAVDVHTHWIPAHLLDRLQEEPSLYPTVRVRRLGDGGEVVLLNPAKDPTRGRHLRVVRAHWDLTVRLSAMKRMGVDVQVLSPVPYLWGHGLTPDGAVRWCRMVNEALAEATQRHPRHFRYCAVLPMHDAELATQELTRALDDMGAVGIAVATRVEGTYLDDPRFAPFWETADRHAAWILLHPLVEAGPASLHPFYLTNLIGHPVETAIAAARLLLGGILLRYPRVRVCLAHGGGVLPFLLGRLERGRRVRAELGNVTQPIRESFRRFYFDTLTHDPDLLSYLIRRVGASHVCVGSDFPADMGDPDPLRTVHAAPGLSDEERAAIIHASALDLAGLSRAWRGSKGG